MAAVPALAAAAAAGWVLEALLAAEEHAVATTPTLAAMPIAASAVAAVRADRPLSTRAMEDAAPSEPRAKLTVAGTWRRLNFEQRAAAVGSLLLIVSTLGPFSFVEAAIVLIGAAVLLLLRRRAEQNRTATSSAAAS